MVAENRQKRSGEGEKAVLLIESAVEEVVKLLAYFFYSFARDCG